MKHIFTFRQSATIFLLCLFPLLSEAHNAMLKGTVINAATLQPLPNVVVSLEGSIKTTLSDALGRFSFAGLQEQRYNITVSSIGFAPLTISVLANELSVTDLRLALHPAGLELKEVAISAGRKQDLNQVSAIDFKLRPMRTTQDLLRVVPGLFIAQHAGGGKAEQIFLRGFDIDHGTDINITVDGMPVNMVSHAHGQGYADLHWVIPETIESFRFGKGPYYAEVGDLGTAGYVAFKTKDALDHNLVKIEAGNFNTGRAVALLKMPFSGKARETQSGYFGGEYYHSDGPFESSQNFNRYNGIARYNVFLNRNNLLHVTGSYFYSKWDASGQVPDRAVKEGLIGRFGSLDNTEGGTTGRANLNLQLTSQLSDGTSWKNQVYYAHYDFSLYSNFTLFLLDSLNGDQIHQSESRHVYGYNTAFTRESHIGTRDLTLTLGGGLRHDRINDIMLERTKARMPLGVYNARGDIRQLNSFGWTNGVLNLSPKLTVNAGLRYDNITYEYYDRLTGEHRKTSASRFSPKLNFSFSASRNVKLFLNTGGGFHSNDARVAVPRNGKEILPPAYGADLGATFKAWDRLVVTAALWTLYLQQEFVYVGDEGVVEAGGRTIRNGVDLSLRYQALPWLFADVDLNYSHARSAEPEVGEDKYIPLAPNFTSIGGLTAQWKNGLRAGLRYRYIADRPANEGNTVTAKGYFINDLVCGYTHKRFDYSLSVENLFNVEWNEAQFDTESRLNGEAEPVSELHYTPGTPLFFKLGLSYSF